jgi:hypothetical protein
LLDQTPETPPGDRIDPGGRFIQKENLELKREIGQLK